MVDLYCNRHFLLYRHVIFKLKLFFYLLYSLYSVVLYSVLWSRHLFSWLSCNHYIIFLTMSYEKPFSYSFFFLIWKPAGLPPSSALGMPPYFNIIVHQETGKSILEERGSDDQLHHASRDRRIDPRGERFQESAEVVGPKTRRKFEFEKEEEQLGFEPSTLGAASVDEDRYSTTPLKYA